MIRCVRALLDLPAAASAIAGFWSGALLPTTPLRDQVAAPRIMLADAGCKVGRVLRTIEERGIDAYVAIGSDGKLMRHGSSKRSHTRALQQKWSAKRGCARVRRRTAIVEPVFGWRAPARLPSLQHAWAAQGRRRVEPRLPRAEIRAGRPRQA